MWWKQQDPDNERAAWGARLETGDYDDATLTMAARLDAAAAQDVTAPEPFRTELVQRLLDEYAAQTNPDRWMRLRRYTIDTPRWLLAPALLLLLVLALISRVPYVRLLGKIDDWQYVASHPPFLDGTIWPPFASHTSVPSWALASIRGALGLFGLLFAAALSFLVLRQLYGWLAKPQRWSPYWSRLAVRTMAVSAGALLLFAVIAVGLGGTYVNQRASVVFYDSSRLSLRSYSDATRLNFQAEMSPAVRERIGFSVDGAKDIGNFRENLAAGYLPLPTDVTPEGLFYDYFFDTGEQTACAALFCPSYALAVSPDPISGRPQTFLAVGLNSGIAEADFRRKPLNLVIVLDISGSMDEQFNRYYYDATPRAPADQADSSPTKMAVASQAVAGLLGHLAPEDRLGIVLFNDDAHLAKPMRLVGQTDMAALAGHLAQVQANGGTNMAAGYRMAADLVAPFQGQHPVQVENRIIFVTDAQPNQGLTGEDDLLAMTQDAAGKGIFTTFVGVGVDFNTTLIESIGKVTGANYYAVHSAAEFLDRMDRGFDYMVTPLVFDLELTFAAEDYEIERVYGAPLANQTTGRLLHVNTLFPSDREGGEVKGGLVLLQLRRQDGTAGPAAPATLTVTYQDRGGQPYHDSVAVALPESTVERYDNPGIRKGILLARYANLLQNWLLEARVGSAPAQASAVPAVNQEDGIPVPADLVLGQWERTSLPLAVSPAYRELFGRFATYFEAEAAAIGDADLAREGAVLQRLAE